MRKRSKINLVMKFIEINNKIIEINSKIILQKNIMRQITKYDCAKYSEKNSKKHCDKIFWNTSTCYEVFWNKQQINNTVIKYSETNSKMR